MTTTTIEKMLERAADYEKKAAALRLAAAEMNGHHTAIKQAAIEATIASAAKLRRQQRPQPEPAVEASPQPTPEQRSDYKATLARRAAKNEQILAILREHGGPMKISDLAAAARARGIRSLTGIMGLVKAGVLTTRGKGRNRARRTYALAATS